ncbi:Crp/Fnr family transcriptional regulator [Paracoccus albus]|uniref:Crp/Fnr family transcriptional regulator n=1 Tax=Paracoccus albus TaxID=3017784 RepID=UPI0022F082AF|nr:cyclic nucleotide-binding domain-containing protein [Paracoccus albus]WBU61237.1 cyclic nucleotide-binding domain-containing protein [Paracoccus albus]
MKLDFATVAKSSVLLGHLPEDALARVLDCAIQREFRPGDVIFLQGEPATAIFLIVEGAVKLFRISPGGAEAVVSVLGPSRSFAEAVALREESYPVSSEAITHTTLLQIDGVRLRRQIAEDPSLALNLLAASYVHLHGLVEQVERLKARSGVQRLAEFLIDLAETGSNGVNGAVPKLALPYNKALIAGQLGLQPESLSRAFAKLRDFGVHIEGNTAQIDDLDRLREIANQDKGQPWMR